MYVADHIHASVSFVPNYFKGKGAVNSDSNLKLEG